MRKLDYQTPRPSRQPRAAAGRVALGLACLGTGTLFAVAVLVPSLPTLALAAVFWMLVTAIVVLELFCVVLIHGWSKTAFAAVAVAFFPFAVWLIIMFVAAIGT